jgi:hypothetical protein
MCHRNSRSGRSGYRLSVGEVLGEIKWYLAGAALKAATSFIGQAPSVRVTLCLVPLGPLSAAPNIARIIIGIAPRHRAIKNTVGPAEFLDQW